MQYVVLNLCSRQIKSVRHTSLSCLHDIATSEAARATESIAGVFECVNMEIYGLCMS